MAYHVLKETELSELNELNASALGVIQKDSGTAMDPNIRTLVIGLGGMGLTSVHQLKKTLEERIGKIPDSSSDIKFLAIDTSKTDLSNKVESGVLSEKEVFLLYNDRIGIEIRRSLDKEQRDLVSRSVENILPPIAANFNPTLSGQGANQIRMAGRLSLMEPDIFNALYNRISQAVAGLENFVEKKLKVYIVAGIGGGSGSGLVIDIPYLVRKVLNDLGVRENRTSIFGYIYLPNIYDNGEVANLQNAYRNGYAALKEIDYYMNIDQIKETYDAIYPSVGSFGGNFSSGAPIFNLCTLIGGRIATNIIIQNTKKAAVDCCVANLINQVTSAKASRDGNNDSIADTFSSDAFLDNVTQSLRTIIDSNSEANFHGNGNYKYACVGSSTLKFPSNAIVECFIGDAYTKMNEMLRKNVESLTQKDVDKFAEGLISSDDFMRAAMARFSSDVDQVLENQEWNKGTVESTVEIDRQLNLRIEKIVNEFDADGQLSLNAITTANNKATEIFQDPARGPLYLATLLTSSSKEGGKVFGYYEMLDLYVNKISERMQGAERVCNEAIKSKTAIAQEMQHFGKFKSNLGRFKEVFKQIYLKRLEAKLAEKLKNDYYHAVNTHIGVCYRMKQNLDQNFLYYVDLITYIASILENNKTVCARELNATTAEAGNILAFGDDECLRPLKYSVENTLESKRRELTDEAIRAFAGALTRNMLANKEDWAITDSVNKHFGASRPAKALRTFIKNYAPFSDVVNQTFSGYFEEAYKNENDQEKTKIVNFLVNYLSSHSSPMFNVWADFSWASIKNLQYQYMVIPNNMGEYWGKKFKDAIGISSFGSNVYESPDQSAIYNYTMYAGMPIWLHSDIIRYETDYYASQASGIHINESDAFQPAYKDYPALMPKEQWFHATEGINRYENANETAILNEVKDLVRFCLDYGILHRDESDSLYLVSRIQGKPRAGSEELRSFITAYCDKPENVENGQIKKGAHLFRTLLKQYGENILTIPSVGINNIRPTKEDDLAMIIRPQMKLLQALRAEKAFLVSENSVLSMIEEANEVRIKNLRVNDFFRFLFYGLIAPGDKNVWSYRLGEKLWPITSPLEVSEKRPEMVPYMEMEVLEAFYAPKTSAEHIDLLKAGVSKINQAIIDGSFDTAVLKENYDKFTGIADNKLRAFKMKLNNGESLTEAEKSIQSFYEKLKASFDTFWSLFA